MYVIALMELALALDGFLQLLETLIVDSSNLKSFLNFNGRLSFELLNLTYDMVPIEFVTIRKDLINNELLDAIINTDEGKLSIFNFYTSYSI